MLSFMELLWLLHLEVSLLVVDGVMLRSSWLGFLLASILLLLELMTNKVCLVGIRSEGVPLFQSKLLHVVLLLRGHLGLIGLGNLALHQGSWVQLCKQVC